jgi:hypothetical protein
MAKKKHNYEVGQIYIGLEQYKNEKWVWKVEITAVYVDMVTARPIEFDTRRGSTSSIVDINYAELRHEWELDATYKALEQFDDELKELLK